MTHRNIFAYTAPDASYPEFFSLNTEDGKVEVTLRAPAGKVISGDIMQMGFEEEVPAPGATVSMTLPPAAVAELSLALLALPPVEALNGAVPLVLYFGNEKDRDEFVALVQEAKPGLAKMMRL